jgi:hypothetical protein
MKEGCIDLVAVAQAQSEEPGDLLTSALLTGVGKGDARPRCAQTTEGAHAHRIAEERHNPIEQREAAAVLVGVHADQANEALQMGQLGSVPQGQLRGELLT